MNVDKKLSGKIALITGAAQGIGAAIAKCFARSGADLSLLDLKEQQVREFADSLAQNEGVRALPLAVDVSSKQQVIAAVSKAVAHFGRIDILINNAGVNVFSDPIDLKQEDWEGCLGVDLSGTWHCCQAVLPVMLDNQYGHIVNIASVHGHKIIPGSFPYPVAKHGLVGMTRALGVEYAAQGIRVNSISPGLIDTPLVQAHFASSETADLERKKLINFIPCKRMGNPEEVANTALFLASDDALFINATDILIDGGRSQIYHD
ncbi:SDR family oxidoreductase [Microbulbifer sp. 2205BS26-8]|uniref:SDR family oxidoreductase n=1 Tax=Microbulbifer sp. 2205BS26-8 TaxID=3064386 RepID=UPI00273F4541|nr:SDR family oxidoreductase [Microbulbifer sp. 2205BS26-8]MDP5210805.1 SDR family oxidoreductase [Microbulbifer sp. 2205BS26-8]